MTDANATGGFKPEVGKYCRTRGGKKVGPILRDLGGHFYAYGENGGCWHDDGAAFGGDPTNDLVAEWVDEPAPAVQFKPGDLVRFKADAESQAFRSRWFADMPEVLVFGGVDSVGDAGFIGPYYCAALRSIEPAPPVVVREGVTYIDYTGETVGPMKAFEDRFIAVCGDGRVWNADGSVKYGKARRLVAEVPAPDPVEAPWYPDDSGEWIEHDGGPCPVAPGAVVNVLMRSVRDFKEVITPEFTAGSWPSHCWEWGAVERPSNIVAYRIVRAAPQPAIDNPQAVDGGADKPAGGRFEVEVRSGYYPLFRVLEEALDQSQSGKGKERHARGEMPFVDQPILSITCMVGPGGPAFQTIKNVQEACGMIERGEHDRAVRELLGAIVYTAAMVIAVREKKEAGDAS